MIIIGAGLSGLIAATQFPHATIIEARSGPAENHHALLRFRSDAIGLAVRIPFRKVRVHKAIWHEGRLHSKSDLRMQNLYSLKVTGKVLGRSIENLEPVDRWVAPQHFYNMLESNVSQRITYGFEVNKHWFAEKNHAVVSTMPMFELAKLTGYQDALQSVKFNYASIRVKRYIVPDADVFQTIYFPDSNGVYRASITGDLLIVESMDQPNPYCIAGDVLPAFGIKGSQIKPLDDTTQRFGKIAPIDEATRQAFIFKMTMDRGIYSLGRFATWRNILLDDVLTDIERIREIHQMSTYHKVLKGALK